MKQYGNRRSNEELLELQTKYYKDVYELDEQQDFKGTQEQLEKMQNFERAYINGSPLLSDEEWDILKKKFNYQESVSAGSPSGRRWIKLLSPLPSIEKAGNYEELYNFLKKYPGEKFRVECKLDGLTAAVRYELHGDFYRLSTISSRGNGRYGLELNKYALAGVNLNVPEAIHAKYIYYILGDTPESIDLRGEAVIPKNEKTYEIYGENAVWRNIASGMFNRKVPFNVKGVYEYLNDGNSIETYMDKQETDNITIENPSEKKLYLSLLDYPNRILKNDEVKIYKNEDGYKIVVIRDNEIIFSGVPHEEYLDIVFYSISLNGVNTDNGKLNAIPGLKTIDQIKESFDVPREFKGTSKNYTVTDSIYEIIDIVDNFYGCVNGKRNKNLIRWRNNYEYACDGIVVKLLNSTAETQGMDIRNAANNPNKLVMQKYPNDMIAVKLRSEITYVKLDKIEYNEATELGNITCTGILDKEYATESGALVSRINLHNPEWLRLNSWIKEGNTYPMIMSMDIIPVLLNSELE